MAGGLALAGAPPSALFLSEFGLLAAGFGSGRALAAAVLLACLGLAFAGLLFHTARMALGVAPVRLARGESRLAAALVGAPLLLIAGLGLYLPPPLVAALEQVALVLGGV